MIWAATGHRPDKLGGYSDRALKSLNDFANITIAEMLGEDAGLELISGMADGWDMAVAEACVDLGVPFIAAVPFRGQPDLWDPETQKRYIRLIARARSTTVLFEGGFAVWKMHARNRWMVERADKVLALWNKQRGGGTWNCVEYAVKKNKEVKNLWEEWQAWE